MANKYQKPYKQGYKACLEGDEYCPHMCGSKDWEWWWNGWTDAIPEKQRGNNDKEKKTVELQPSRLQLIFGGFPIKTEPRCQKCETIVAKKIEKMMSIVKTTEKAIEKACKTAR